MPAPSPSALVGRDRELAILRTRLDSALVGHGSLVLIGGEAGIGKTALAETLCREADTQGALVLVGRCYDLTETPPYGPWIELFGQYHAADGQSLLPAAFIQPGVLGQIASRAAFFQQVLDFLTALALISPLVLFLDDLHWSDPASLDLIRVVARASAAIPLLIVATYRADEVPRHHLLYQLLPLLVREARITRLDLLPLSGAAMRALITAHYVLPAEEGDRLLTYLSKRADGNPFFVEELLRRLEGDGGIQRTEEGDRLGDLAGMRLPPLLRQVLDGRIARLSPPTQHLLTGAVVIGQQVPFSLWAAVMQADEEALATAVEEALEARIIELTADDDGVRFVHALIREALYEGIVPVRRGGWHRRVGEALIAGANPDPDAVAFHFRRAGDARTTEWLIKAGDRARHSQAWLTAAERYEAAVARMREAGASAAERGWLLYRISRARRWDDARASARYLDEAEEEGRRGGDDALVALARLMRGTVRYYGLYDWRQGFDEIVAGAAAVLALPAEAKARLAPYFVPSSALMGLRTLYSVTGRFAEAVAAAEEWEAMDRSSLGADAHTPVLPCGPLGSVAYLTRGQPRAAFAAFAEDRAAWEAAEDYHQLGWGRVLMLQWAIIYFTEQRSEQEQLAREGEAAFTRATGIVSGLSSRVAYLPLLLHDGQWAEAGALLATLASVSENLSSYVFTTKSRGTLAYRQGETAVAWEQVRNVLLDGPETAPGYVSFDLGTEMLWLAAALSLDAEDVMTARQWLEAHDQWLDWNDAVYGRSAGHALWARYHRLAGEHGVACEQADQALSCAMEPRQPLALLAAHRLAGDLATDTGRFADAASHLEASLALADACAAPFERALTLLAVAELRAARGERAEALALIDEVRAICVPLGARPTLERADAFAARLADRRDAAPAYPASLTAREVEVVRLLAAGRTNREIADTLFLSVHTVRAHLRSILNKTDTTSRAAAVSFAFQHDLA